MTAPYSKAIPGHRSDYGTKRKTYRRDGGRRQRTAASIRPIEPGDFDPMSAFARQYAAPLCGQLWPWTTEGVTCTRAVGHAEDTRKGSGPAQHVNVDRDGNAVVIW